MKKLNSSGFGAIQMLLVIVIVGLIGGVGYFVYISQKQTNQSLTNNSNGQSEPQKSTKKVTTPSTKPTTLAPSTSPSVARTGTITGAASYPSSGLPADEEVCAVSIYDETKTTCINVGKDQTIKYSLKVPVGDYYVYSTATKELKGKAYYDEYAKCGNQSSCPDTGHTAYIKVQVADGSTVNDINPTDWYAPTIQNY